MSTRDTTVEEIALLPGFVLLEFTPGHAVIKVPTEYTLKITRLPPFLTQFAETEETKDPGPMKITVLLLAKIRPPGIEQEILYEPPVDENGVPKAPDKESHQQAWEYFQQWRTHEQDRVDRRALLAYRRWDILFANCVTVLDGPKKIEDDEWLVHLLPFIDSEPSNITERKLLFLKTQVIAPDIVRSVIERLTLTEEVTIEGIKKAFDSFRSTIRRS